ncbi:MAG: NADH-quinone oxidoreductase subunit L, partial [Acidimicrobiia bacterium]
MGDLFARSPWLMPVIPATSFLLILFFGKRLPKKGAEVGIPALLVTFVGAAILAARWIAEREILTGSARWFEAGGFDIEAGYSVDGLTVMMFVVVSFVSLMVHIYSTAYLHGDSRYTHFFAFLSLFTASMLFMVIADSTLLVLIGWELVGLCSFALIGHWFEETANSGAAIKAFLTTRTGDVGLLLGIITLFFAVGGNFDIGHLNEAALNGEVNHGLLFAGAALLLLGVAGKSAQFPLHVWLPDAMAGPTPVSALIHAATMVVAGVYLVARLYGVFWAGFNIEAGGINLLAGAGAVTMIIAAALAFVQDDIKKVLAYSTVSQLGYMVAALGVGAWTAGVFHLFTHAFFKALLFLGSGSVIHACHSNNMSEMGGLRKFMPTTYKTFMIGTAALAGLPPLAGFFSKDEILLGAREGGFPLVLILGLITAFMTAAYMGRACLLTFFGNYRGHGHPHESPPAMVWPLRLLAVLSIGVGLLNAPGISRFSEWVTFEAHGTDFHLEHHEFDPGLAILSVAVALAGIFLATRVWGPGRVSTGAAERSSVLRGLRRLLVEKYYLDRLFVDGVVGSVKGPVAREVYRFDQRVINGLVNGIALLARVVGRFSYDVVDQRLVDGAVNGIGVSASETGGLLRLVQSGRVQQYALL